MPNPAFNETADGTPVGEVAVYLWAEENRCCDDRKRHRNADRTRQTAQQRPGNGHDCGCRPPDRGSWPIERDRILGSEFFGSQFFGSVLSAPPSLDLSDGKVKGKLFEFDDRLVIDRARPRIRHHLALAAA